MASGPLLLDRDRTRPSTPVMETGGAVKPPPVAKVPQALAKVKEC
jgi:hypothetical protein